MRGVKAKALRRAGAPAGPGPRPSTTRKNHGERRSLRLAAQRTGKHAGQRRGRARPQDMTRMYGAGPSEKTIGRILKEYA